MYEWEIILGLVTIFIILILMIKKYANNSTKVAFDKITESALAVNDNQHGLNNNLEIENNSLKSVNNLQQLRLAILLIEKALPVWRKYIYSPEFLHYAAFADAQNTIESNLLQKSIEQIKLTSNLNFANGENKNIKQLYNDFVNPVIALQDGIWKTPYPVKKIFLSVYYLLKSLVEDTSTNDKENFLRMSIGYATDCLDLSKLYSSDEVTSFLEMHKTNT